MFHVKRFPFLGACNAKRLRRQWLAHECLPHSARVPSTGAGASSVDPRRGMRPRHGPPGTPPCHGSAMEDGARRRRRVPIQGRPSDPWDGDAWGGREGAQPPPHTAQGRDMAQGGIDRARRHRAPPGGHARDDCGPARPRRHRSNRSWGSAGEGGACCPQERTSRRRPPMSTALDLPLVFQT